MAKKETFEGAIAELGDIIKQLERGEATLDESLGLFERGVALSKSCAAMLDSAEQKVSILLKNSVGEVEEKAFSPSGEA